MTRPEVAGREGTAGGEPSFRDLARRVDELREEARHLDERPRALTEGLLEAVVEFNRAGLVALVRSLRADPRGEELLLEAMAQPEVMGLLIGHRIVRGGRGLETARVLESIRPYLFSHGLEVDLVRVDGDVAVVRMEGGTAELRDGLRETLLTRVPGLRAVEEETGQVHEHPDRPAFVPLERLRRRPP